LVEGGYLQIATLMWTTINLGKFGSCGNDDDFEDMIMYEAKVVVFACKPSRLGDTITHCLRRDVSFESFPGKRKL
jgi:hypothetical protein